MEELNLSSYFDVDRLQALVKGVFADFTVELAATSRDDLGEETLITAVKRANY